MVTEFLKKCAFVFYILYFIRKNGHPISECIIICVWL
jgi:hypothetical protein